MSSSNILRSSEIFLYIKDCKSFENPHFCLYVYNNSHSNIWSFLSSICSLIQKIKPNQVTEYHRKKESNKFLNQKVNPKYKLGCNFFFSLGTALRYR